MQVDLWLTGKTKGTWVNSAMDDYLQRVQRYCNLNVTIIPESKNKTAEAILRDESKQLKARLDKSPRAFTILLDEDGKQYSSRGLAGVISRQQAQGQNYFRLIIGGAYGVDHDLHRNVDLVLSLSLMTFPHQLVRVILAEQLYRAFTILRGEGYHH